MPNFAMTREEHTQAVLKAMDEVHQRNMQSKEASRRFLIEAGIIQEDKNERKSKSNKKKSK